MEVVPALAPPAPVPPSRSTRTMLLTSENAACEEERQQNEAHPSPSRYLFGQPPAWMSLKCGRSLSHFSFSPVESDGGRDKMLTRSRQHLYISQLPSEVDQIDAGDISRISDSISIGGGVRISSRITLGLASKGSLSSFGAPPRGKSWRTPSNRRSTTPRPLIVRIHRWLQCRREVGRHRATFPLATQLTHPPSMWAASFACLVILFYLQPPPLLSCLALAATLV